MDMSPVQLLHFHSIHLSYHFRHSICMLVLVMTSHILLYQNTLLGKTCLDIPGLILDIGIGMFLQE